MILGVISLSSFNAVAPNQNQKIIQKRTIIEFGSYYRGFQVNGDPSTGEIIEIV